MVTVRTAYVISTYLLRLSAAHKAVTQVGVVDCMLREEVPPKVLLVAHAFLGGVRTRMAHVPCVPMKTAFIHGLANTTITRVAHVRHHLTIELANAPELLAGDREAGEGGAGLYVEVLRRWVELLLRFRLEGQRHLWWIEQVFLKVCSG